MTGRLRCIPAHVSGRVVSGWAEGGGRFPHIIFTPYHPDSTTPFPLGCKVPEGVERDDEKILTISKVKIMEGYYRHSRYTAQTFECRHPKACAGTSTDPYSDDVEKMRLEGDELCRVGFTGAFHT